MMARNHPRTHRRLSAVQAQPTPAPATPATAESHENAYLASLTPRERMFHTFIAHAFYAGAEAGGCSLNHLFEAFKESFPNLDAHVWWHIEDETRSTFVKHEYAWLRKEYGEDWRDQITTTPNPHGNCDECFHPFGRYALLFPDGTPGDIRDCECSCHFVSAEDVPQ